MKNKIGTEIECIMLWYYAAFLKQKKYRKDKNFAYKFAFNFW